MIRDKPLVIAALRAISAKPRVVRRSAVVHAVSFCFLRIFFLPTAQSTLIVDR